MFLSNILKKKQISKDLVKLIKLDLYKKKINNKVVLLKHTDKTFYSKKVYISKPKNLIQYIVTIKLLAKNTFIIVTDSKTNLRLYKSAGCVGLTGKQKTRHVLSLKNLIESLKNEATFLQNKNIALHLTNVNFFSYKYIISNLSKIFFITYVKVLNSKPHNGCRPKKIRRGRHRKR